MNGCNVNIILSLYITKQTYFRWRELNQLRQLELREQKSPRGWRLVGGAIRPLGMGIWAAMALEKWVHHVAYPKAFAIIDIIPKRY